MRRWRRTWLEVAVHSLMTRAMPLILASLLAGLIWLLEMATDLPALVRQPSPDMPDFMVEGAQARRFDAEGRLVTWLTASSAQHLPQDDTMLYEGIRLEHHRADTPKVTVISERARTIHRAEEVWLDGKVELRRARSANNAELVVRTRDIYVDTVKQLARSSAPMSADMGRQHMSAVGFVADNRNETLQLLSQVKMTYVPK